MPSKPDYYKELLTSAAGIISGRILDCIDKQRTPSYVTVRHTQSDWYRANRPVIEAPWRCRRSSPRPSRNGHDRSWTECASLPRAARFASR
ncbi:MAG: hypothetical protein MZV65_40570 [Chromatiales bacterium]|nr:hypothetical protein [Chromatiales bacterium]